MPVKYIDNIHLAITVGMEPLVKRVIIVGKLTNKPVRLEVCMWKTPVKCESALQVHFRQD